MGVEGGVEKCSRRPLECEFGSETQSVVITMVRSHEKSLCVSVLLLF